MCIDISIARHFDTECLLHGNSKFKLTPIEHKVSQAPQQVSTTTGEKVELLSPGNTLIIFIF